MLDGLGWLQLRERERVAPNLASMIGGAITSVAPTTTATALTSISLGSAPAAHGMVGFRVRVDGEPGDQVLNTLRWTTSSGDARERVDPSSFLAGRAFAGRPVPVVSGAAFEGSGFTIAHLAGSRPFPWYLPSSLPVETTRLLAAGEPLVYAYYPGVDTIAHATGFGAYYDAELTAADRLVAAVAAGLPAGAALVVTADHGQVDVGERVQVLDEAVAEPAELVSGEARFLWLHARPGAAADLLVAAEAGYGDVAWVRSIDQVEEEGWFGGKLPLAFRRRVGDVAVVPWAPIGLLDEPERTERRLVCRHGSLTPEEMLVPLLAVGA